MSAKIQRAFDTMRWQLEHVVMWMQVGYLDLSPEATASALRRLRAVADELETYLPRAAPPADPGETP